MLASLPPFTLPPRCKRISGGANVARGTAPLAAEEKREKEGRKRVTYRLINRRYLEDFFLL